MCIREGALWTIYKWCRRQRIDNILAKIFTGKKPRGLRGQKSMSFCERIKKIKEIMHAIWFNRFMTSVKILSWKWSKELFIEIL
jgi:hypothetical protein